MKHVVKLLLIFLLFNVLSIYGQNEKEAKKLKEANKIFVKFAYIDAIKVYLEVAESGYQSQELFQRLGDSYYFNANYLEAVKWYDKLFLLTDDNLSIYFLRYSQSLKATGENELANILFDQYAEKEGLVDDDFKTAEDYLLIIENNSNRYLMEPLSINTDGVDFGVGIQNSDSNNKKIIFASTGAQTKLSKNKIEAWTGLAYLDLYEANIDKSGIISDPIKLKGDINTDGHESSAIFTENGKTMYFTRNNVLSRKEKRKEKRVKSVQLKIYRAHLIDGVWTNIEDLSINGTGYSTAHPMLNAAEDKLFFVSNMPQSFGQTDIFMADINPDGTLEAPVNVGTKVNTKGRESFPYLTDENALYFSSDGHFGLGGYDVFYIASKDNNFSGNLLNVGKPINSSFDDFAFVINNGKGYVSSNRKEGKEKENDNIYSFVETKPIKELTTSKIHGVVIDENTQLPLASTIISVLNLNNEDIAIVKTNNSGYYEVKEVDRFQDYVIKSLKRNYDGADAFSGKNEKDREVNFELTRNTFEPKNGDDIAKVLNIIIYFNLDKSSIRKDAQLELEKIIVVLKQNPDMNIDVRSHTDSRAEDSYNMRLSQKRNKATIRYIVKKGGISPDRLTGRGYGETELINNCRNNVDCSEEFHQENRRSEFIVVD